MNSDAPNKFFKEIPLDENYTDEIDEYFVQLFISNKPHYEILKKEFEHKWEKYFKEKQDYLNSIHTEKNKNWHFVSWEEVCAIYECHYHNEVSPFSFDYKFKGKKYGLLFVLS